MERNFKLAPKDGVGVKVYREDGYELLRIIKEATHDGVPFFAIQRVEPDGKNIFIVPAEIVEGGGFCVGQADGTVWEFPTVETYNNFTNSARRSRQNRLLHILRKFNPRRLLPRK